jgi:hypothetical protein
MKKFDSIGLAVPEFYLPRPGIDLSRWAVIACDQFTSEQEYWDEVQKIVGDAPSTYHITLPEVYLGKPQEAERLASVNATMDRYLEQAILRPHEGFVYIERTVAGKTRRGLLVCLDLEKYDYNKNSTSLIRATEGTILDRLPPRIKIREHASLELPHILVLIDDPQDSVIGSFTRIKKDLHPLYDFDLMLGSGHLSGWLVDDASQMNNVAENIARLGDITVYRSKYDLPDARDVLLYAMGDGNHSLATAKAIWEKNKTTVGMDHPSRYALVELENVHDAGLEFEPIHRVVFDIRSNLENALRKYFGQSISFLPSIDMDEMKTIVNGSTTANQRFGLITGGKLMVVQLHRPALNLPVGNLQAFLDQFIKSGGAGSLDYVHGDEAVTNLGKLEGNAGLYLPGMHKSELFKTVILDGALPRKTFSMGEAKEKRFYLEARKIR